VARLLGASAVAISAGCGGPPEAEAMTGLTRFFRDQIEADKVVQRGPHQPGRPAR
jgi:hypothetical protein